MGLLNWMLFGEWEETRWLPTGQEKWVRVEQAPEDDRWVWKREEKEVYSLRHRWKGVAVDWFMDMNAYETVWVRSRWFPKGVDPNDPLIDPEIPEKAKC